MKRLHMNSTVYEATEKYPELIPIIVSWGFPQIRNSFLRRTMGRNYTIREAIRELRLNKSMIVEALRKHGFELVE